MLTDINVHFQNGEHDVNVLSTACSVTIRSKGTLYPATTIYFRDEETANKVAAVLREACNPRQPAGDQEPEIVDEITAHSAHPDTEEAHNHRKGSLPVPKNEIEHEVPYKSSVSGQPSIDDSAAAEIAYCGGEDDEPWTR